MRSNWPQRGAGPVSRCMPTQITLVRRAETVAQLWTRPTHRWPSPYPTQLNLRLVLSLAKPLRHSKLRTMVKEVTADPPVLSAAGPCPLASPSALSTQPLAPSMGQGASGTQR